MVSPKRKDDEPNRPVEDALQAAQRHGSGLRSLNEQLSTLVASLRDSRERMAERSRAGAIGAADRGDSGPGSLAEDAELARRSLAAELSLAREAVAHREAENARLQERLAEIQGENHRLADEFVAVQGQTTELANLYVTLTRLHGALDRREVLAAIGEIVVNMVGSEEMAVFELSEDGRRLEPVFSLGVDDDRLGEISLGSEAIRRTVESREILLPGGARVASREAGLTACVPLSAGEEVTGLLAVFRLLGHKRVLTSGDATLLELLGRHAGMALRRAAPASGAPVEPAR